MSKKVANGLPKSWRRRLSLANSFWSIACTVRIGLAMSSMHVLLDSRSLLVGIMTCLERWTTSNPPTRLMINGLKIPIELLLCKRKKNGYWLLQNRHPGKSFFEMEAAGEPSRWNTLRALRILKWWGAANENAK